MKYKKSIREYNRAVQLSNKEPVEDDFEGKKKKVVQSEKRRPIKNLKKVWQEHADADEEEYDDFYGA